MKLTKWRHKKSGRIYYVIDDNVINTTNGCEHEIMVTYFGRRDGDDKTQRFCRNKEEFLEKFTFESQI